MKRLDLSRESPAWVLAGVLLVVIAYQQFSRLVTNPLDAVELMQLVWEFDAAAEAKDPDRLTSLFDPKAEHFGLTTGRLVRERDALHQLFEDEWSGEAGADEVHTQIVAFRFLTPDVLLGDVTATYTNYRIGERFWPVFREHTMVVLINKDGTWRIAASSAGGHDASQ